MDYQKLGLRIKEVRLNKNLTQQKLSEMAELSPNYIGTIERATGVLSLETLVTISNVLETPITYFLQDCLINYEKDNIDKEIICMLQVMAPKEKHYLLEHMKIFKSFCRSLVDNLLG